MKIEIKEYTKRFGLVTALRGVSLAIEPGTIVAVLGANGSGKTTLLRCLAGVAASPIGGIFYDEELFQRERLDVRRRLMFLPDFPKTFPDWTPLRHIASCLKLYRGEEPEMPVEEKRIVSLLGDLDLLPLAERPLEELSRGQQYKTFLTALLTVDPEVWLLDEPFASGMDPQGLNLFKREATAAVKRGRTIIYTTQILDVVRRFGDRAAVLDKGRLAAWDHVGRLCDGGSGRDDGLDELFERLRENPGEQGG